MKLCAYRRFVATYRYSGAPQSEYAEKPSDSPADPDATDAVMGGTLEDTARAALGVVPVLDAALVLIADTAKGQWSSVSEPTVAFVGELREAVALCSALSGRQ
jgi:hypothetical protein